MDTVLCVDYYSLLAIMIPHTRSVFVYDVDDTYPQSGPSWSFSLIDYTSNRRLNLFQEEVLKQSQRL